MEQDLFSKGIGTKENKNSLLPKPVTIVGKVAESVMGKTGTKNAGKEVGKKLVLLCKHPDKDEPISISTIFLLKGRTVTAMTTWINVDEDGLIQKGSIVATLLDKYDCQSINDLEGKVVQTELGEDKFLGIKAY